jgi:flagellar motility protein MotE (MotC chaperone)
MYKIKKFLILIILLPISILSITNVIPKKEDSTFKCNRVFESRKNELVELLDSINDKKQILESINNATKSVLERKAKSLAKRKINLDEKEKIVNTKIRRLQAAIKRNERILKEIKSILENRITKTYTKMGAAKAAAILDIMENDEAAGILFLLKPKVMSNVLSKMTPQKASVVTLLIKQGPPFKKDTTRYAIKKPDILEKAIKEDFK